MKKSGINMKLTLKQQAFADYYIEFGNATEAARRAGYKGNNINKIASANLYKPHIKEYIEDRVKKVEDNRIAKGDEVLRYLTGILRGEEEKCSLKDKMKAAELLGKRYRLFKAK